MKETLFLAIPIASTYQKMLRLTKVVVQKQERIPPKEFNTNFCCRICIIYIHIIWNHKESWTKGIIASQA